MGSIKLTEPTFTRAYPISTWDRARRFHSGGLPGLASDEVPIVTKMGEGVFTPGQMAALGMAANGNQQQSGGDTHLHLNIDARGATPDAAASMRSQIPGIALAAVQNASQRGGQFSKALRGR